MDLNLFAQPIPAAAQGQETGPGPSAAKPSSPGRAAKSFSSVLRSVRQSDDTSAAHSPKTSDTRARTNSETPDPQPRTNEGKSTDTSARQAHSSEGSNHKGQTTGQQITDETSPDHPEAAPDQTAINPTAQGVVLALLQPATSEESTIHPVSTTSSEDVTDEQLHQGSAQPQFGTISTLPLAAAPVQPATPVATTSMPSPAGKSNAGVTEPLVLFDKALTGSHTTQQESVTGQIHDTGDQSDPNAAPSLPAKDQFGAENKPVVPVQQEKSHESPLTGIQLSDLPQDHQVDEALRQRVQVMETEVRAIRDEQQAPAGPQILAREVNGKEGSNPKAEALAPRPHHWQALSDSDNASGMTWSGDEQPSQEHSDRPFSQAPAVTVQSASDTHTPATSTFAMAAATQAAPRGNELHPVTAASGATVAAPQDVADVSIPGSSRSVVFEVTQPDLGRVNVRVAMTNDLVHTHFSSDRSDVGQLLMNGQDRLQAALQQSGLDMGQFRVDIDRQSAGRSFQQGHTQDQGRTWQQQPGSGQGEHRPSDPQDGGRSRLSGMLNLVA